MENCSKVGLGNVYAFVSHFSTLSPTDKTNNSTRKHVRYMTDLNLPHHYIWERVNY